MKADVNYGKVPEKNKYLENIWKHLKINNKISDSGHTHTNREIIHERETPSNHFISSCPVMLTYIQKERMHEN